MNKSNRIQAIAYALALLVLGGVIGSMIKSTTSTTPQTLRLGRVDEIAAGISNRLNDKLDLTPEQKTRIEPMIKKAAEEMEASHLDCLKRVNVAADNLHKEIRAELKPEQLQKLSELDQDRQARMLQKYNYQVVTNASQH